MRFGNVGGRIKVTVGDALVDVESASGGRLPADPVAAFEQWDALAEWAGSADARSAAAIPLSGAALRAPVPRPRQVFGVGLNYRLHVAEGAREVPEEPAVFTKFPSCIAGPTSEIPVGSETVDWEVELVVAVGRTAHRVGAERAWHHVAGIMVGQDISDRAVQMRPPAQWSLAKSFTGFGPTGPFLVTVDEVPDRDDLELGCSVNGEEVQKARTSDLIFPVPELVSRLSHIVTLWPGDLIFTGTPAGVGYARTPPRFLHAGDVVTSYIEGVGELRNPCIEA
ncbi:MAG TPA: fumarylacetoacetate hydrolase family protein [Acidimicrobiales bacterium]|jgi:2,4-didehydro-3-deoxy-L-rhamnonate hydrolase